MDKCWNVRAVWIQYSLQAHTGYFIWGDASGNGEHGFYQKPAAAAVQEQIFQLLSAK